jgi:hypothetical protein
MPKWARIFDQTTDHWLLCTVDDEGVGVVVARCSSSEIVERIATALDAQGYGHSD